MSFDFASDLADESLREALETGNLHGEKTRAQRLAQKPDNRISGTGWVSAGYFASLHHITCRTCGNIESSLLGVFHEEKLSSGTSRLQMLARGLQIPPAAIQPTRHSSFQRDICIKCVDTLGFSLS